MKCKFCKHSEYRHRVINEEWTFCWSIDVKRFPIDGDQWDLCLCTEFEYPDSAYN